MAVLQWSQCFGGLSGYRTGDFMEIKTFLTVPLKWNSFVFLKTMCTTSFAITLPHNILNDSQVLVWHPPLFSANARVFKPNSALFLWLIQPPIPIPGWMIDKKITPEHFKGLCIDAREKLIFSVLHSPSWSKRYNSNNYLNAESENEAIINIAWCQHPVALSPWHWCCSWTKDVRFDFLMVNSDKRAAWMKIWWFVHSSTCHILTCQERFDFLVSCFFFLKNKIRGPVWWILIGIINSPAQVKYLPVYAIKIP